VVCRAGGFGENLCRRLHASAVITAYQRAVIHGETIHSGLWTRTSTSNSCRVKFKHSEHGGEEHHYGEVQRFLSVAFGGYTYKVAELQTHRAAAAQPLRGITLIEKFTPVRKSYIYAGDIVCKAIFVANPKFPYCGGRATMAAIDCIRFFENKD
jgi:hypothetical protein